MYQALSLCHEELLEALRRAHEQEQWEALRDLVRAFALPANGYLSVRGYRQAVEDCLHAAIETARAARHAGDLALFLGELGWLRYQQGNLGASHDTI